MPGRLTRLFSSPHFSMRDDAYWMAFQTYTNCEKAAKTRMDKYGVESYLPLMTVHPADEGKSVQKLQLASVIFARFDLRKYPSMCNHQNFIYPQTHRAVDRQDQVLQVMESCWRVETLSEKFDVERVKSSTPPGMACIIKSGPLSGSEGYCDDTKAFFFLPLPEMDMYARLPLSAKYVVSDSCSKG